MLIYDKNQRIVLQETDIRTPLRMSILFLIIPIVMLMELCYNIVCNLL